MNNKLKFFNEAFKILLAIATTTWAIYLALIFLVEDREGCAAGISGQLFTVLALIAGGLSALPLLYGLLRLLFWPNGQKSRTVLSGGWVMACGIAVFITAIILFALALSQYGCS